MKLAAAGPKLGKERWGGLQEGKLAQGVIKYWLILVVLWNMCALAVLLLLLGEWIRPGCVSISVAAQVP
jgi:hypothetical protein